MTVIVGILCQDGVVIGTDSSATFGNGGLATIEQPTRKLEVVRDKLLVCCTGHVGLSQRFTATVNDLYGNKALTGGPVEIGRAVSKAAIADFTSTHAQILGRPRPNTIGLGAVLAGVHQHRPYLIEFEAETFQPEEKRAEKLWFVAMGSGQAIADPFLGFLRRALCGGKQPTLATGKLLTAWTLDHVCDTNPGGVKAPWHLGVIERVTGDWRGRLLETDELQEHQQMVTAIELEIAEAPERILNARVPEIPPTPEE